MSRDNDDQQQVTQLPEVPQIVQPQPTVEPELVAEVPVAPQPVEQPAVATPDATIPVTAARPAPVTPPAPGSIDGFTSPTQSGISPVNTPVRAMSDTVPVQPSSPAPTPVIAPMNPMFSAPTPGGVQPLQTVQPVKKKTNIVMLVSLIVGSLVVLGGIAAVVFLFVLPGLGKIADSDLVSTNNSSSTYLRPKQWQAITVDGTPSYGDKLAKDGKSTALVAVTKGSYVGTVDSPSDSQIATFRASILSSVSQPYAESLIKKYGVCDATSNVKLTDNTVKNTNSFGIFRIDGTCVKDGANYTVVYSTLLGNDGYIRAITLMATDTKWKLNESVFNKMISSVDQQ